MAVIAPTAYAQVSDLTLYGAPAGAFTSVTAGQQQAAIDAANALVDGYLADKFTLPLTSWGKDLVARIAQIATYDLIVVRGANPEAPGNIDLHDRWEAALRWLRDIADGRVTPNVIDSSAGGTVGGPFVRSLQVDSATGNFSATKPVSGRGW